MSLESPVFQKDERQNEDDTEQYGGVTEEKKSSADFNFKENNEGTNTANHLTAGFFTGLEDVNLVYQKNSEIKMKFSAILIDLRSQG